MNKNGEKVTNREEDGGNVGDQGLESRDAKV